VEWFLGVLPHVVIVIGLLGKLAVMIGAVLASDEFTEAVIRASAFTSGLLLHYGAQALGISITGAVLEAVRLYAPIRFGLVAVVVPSAIGVFLAWYTIRCLERSKNVATRVMILVGVWSIVQFADIYFKAIGTLTGVARHKALAPNLMFTLSISLYAIFRYDPTRSPDRD